MQVASIAYRLYQEKDLNGILNLWKNHSGWGSITENQFNDWYLKTPYGDSQIIVISNEKDEILGQTIFIPSPFLVASNVLKSYRVFAPIIHPDLRTHDFTRFDHPVYTMYRLGLDLAKRNGFSILYSFPSVGWLSMIKTFPKYNLPLADLATYACINIPFCNSRSGNDRLNSSVEIKEVSHFNEEYDQLWEDAVVQFPVHCGIVRQKKLLTYKLAPHLVLEARTMDNRLFGYLAIRKLNGLIIDGLARNPDDLRIVFHNALEFLGKIFSDEDLPPWKKLELKAILTPGLTDIFSSVRSTKVSYDFAFYCCNINETIDPAAISSENWYMMPND